MSPDEGQGEGWVGGVAAELGGDVGAVGLAQHGNRRVAERGQQLRGRTRANAAGVLSERHVANPMQPVLDPPMIARQLQQHLRVGFFAGQ